MGFFTPDVEQLKQERNIPALMKCLKHRKNEIRIQAFIALFDRRIDPEIDEQLHEMMNDRDPRVRNVAVMRYAMSGERQVGSLEKIRQIVIEGTFQEKVEALRVIADWDADEASSIANIIVLALNDKKPMVQIEAIRTMGALRDRTAVFHLEDKLRDPIQTVRVAVVKALGKIASDEAVDLLIGSLTDNKQDVRRTAREALEGLENERAKKALKDAPMMLMVKRMNENVASKQEVLRHIGKHRIKEAMPLVRQACMDDYKTVRFEAIHALGQMRDRSSIPTLVKLIDDPYYDIRLEAVKSLERLTDPECLRAVEKAQSDFNKNVREEAKRAYYSLKARLDEQREKQQ